MISAPLPALSKTWSHFLVEDIVVGKSSFLIPSFTQQPLGAEKLRIMRAEPLGFCRHIMPLTFAAAGRSLGWKGPAAKPAVIQSATASVTCAANSKALGALLLTVGSLAKPRQPISAPFSKSLQTWSSNFVSLNFTDQAKFLSLCGQIVDLPDLVWLVGNFSQKSGPGSAL